MMKTGDQVILDNTEIEFHILNFYKDLFAVDNNC